MSEKTTIRVNGRVIDLINSLPLTLGDWEKLEVLGVVEGALWKLSHARASIDFIHILAMKQDAGITREMVSAIDLNDMPIFAEITSAVNKGANQAVENPTT